MLVTLDINNGVHRSALDGMGKLGHFELPRYYVLK